MNPDSISIDDDILVESPNFVEAIISVIPSYDSCGETEINKDQWIEIGHRIIDGKSKEL